MDQPFFSTLGVEFSFVMKSEYWSVSEKDRIEGYTNLLRADLKDDGIPAYKVMNDEGAVEIASPPFRNLKELEAYHAVLNNVVRKYPLATHNDFVYSGGGHIHVGIPYRLRKKPVVLFLFLLNLFRDVTNRPYLNWIFNEWCDVTSANNFVCHPKKGLATVDDAFMAVLFRSNPKIPKDWTTRMALKLFDVAKGYAVRVDESYFEVKEKPPTVEFRFFDAAKCFPVLRHQVNFVNAYMRFIESHVMRRKIIPIRVKKKSHINWFKSHGRAENSFNHLLGRLGLPRSDYSYFIDTNFWERKKAGWLR